MVQVRATQIIGSHPSMLALNDQINYLASSPGQPVFIHGEPGTGKRLVARGLHEATHGTSADCRYLNGVWYRTAGSLRELRTVQGGGDSPDVLGGLDRGTLIVHEVSQLCIEVQRALVEWIEAAQSGRFPQRRLVATSSVSINKLQASPAFDAKLLAILSTTRLELLPLSERGDDVLLLTRYFLERDGEVFHAKALPLDSAVQQQVLAAPFMGNVSELEWYVQKSLIQGRWLTESLFPATSDDARKLQDSQSHIHLILRLGEMTLDQVEAHFIHEVLRLCKGSQSQAAHLLGLSRGALYRRLEKFPEPAGGAVVRRWRRRGRGAASRDVKTD
jgi:DNA-binding NtrC family response regulator